METIGKYRIEDKIGSGGFGEVFRGFDPFIKRHVAIKTCGSDDPKIAERFSREAEIGGNLHHRNVTTVYDFGVHDGRPYLVQEYLTGEDLDVKIKRRDYLPYSEKLLYLLQVARGLAYAHARGVIHRDVKPANIRVLGDGTAKIMDFGIAKLAQQESGLTQTGMTLGTAAYLAPEQVRGDDVDLRTDVFSFGVLAYELLTFERPFQGEQISTVLYNLLHREPEPLTAHWPGAPPELVALVNRCLRKDAGQRFADGRELVRELERLKHSGSGAPPPGPPTRPIATSRTAAPAEAAAETRVIAAPDGPPAGEPQATTPRGASGLEYRLAPDRPPTETPVAAAGKAGRRRRSSAGSAALLLALAAVAAGGGWWLGTRGQSDDPDPALTAPEAAAPAVIEDVPTEDFATTSPAPPPTPEARPGPPPEPPPPASGQLLLPRVLWTDRMIARVNGRDYALHRRHTIELPPGSYRAVFRLDAKSPTGGGTARHYRPASRTVEIEVLAGQSSPIEIPIPRPGAFSVRPFPGRAQGRVSIDGELLGSTPVSGIRREPGVYTLEILPREGDEGSLEEQITLKAGQELILSFDLDAGTLETRTKALIP